MDQNSNVSRIAKVDDRGRVTLGAAFAGKYLEIVQDEHGRVVIHPVTVTRVQDLPDGALGEHSTSEAL